MPTVHRALRSLASRPVFSAVTVATLALGLGVNTAIFSLTREVVLRPLPYRDANRLVAVFETSQTLGVTPDRAQATAPANFVAWRGAVDAFEQTAYFRRAAFNVAGRGTPEQVEGFRVSPTFFPMLGIDPLIGRGFTDADAQPGADAVVLLNNGFWRRRFAGDPSIVGQSIDVDGTPCIVAGVLPPSFRIFRVLDREVDLFRPFVVDPTDRERSMVIWARLRPGTSLERARTELASVYAALPIPNHLWTGDAAWLSARFAAQSRPILLRLQWAVGFVLLIACANIANLLLAVSAGRRKELAVREALGATRWRIARDLGGETAILAAAGGALAIVLAAWIVAVLNATVSFQDVNRVEPFRIDGWVLAFTGALVLAVALIFTLLPARAASAADLVESLKESSHGATAGVANRRLRHALIVGELALSIVLAAAALALARSALTLQTLARGVAVDRVMTAQVSLNDPRYADTSRLVRTAATMVDRLASSPGIVDAALVNYLPVSTIRVGVPVVIEGQAALDEPFVARYFVATPNYFRTAGIPIRAGRDFTAADDATRPGVAIVSETFVRRFWTTTDVVGRRFRADFPQSLAFWVPRGYRGWLTVVGVVADVREDGLPDSAGLPQLYVPYAQNPTIVATLVARTGEGSPALAAAAAIRDAVRAADPQAPVSYEMSFAEAIQETFTRPREMAWIVGAFAVLALLLAGVGVYGVMSYLAAARTREIGIRLALGATRGDIASLVLRHAFALTAAGAALGAIATPLVLRFASGLLFGVGPFDPATLVAVAALLAAVALAASAIPAVRAARQAAVSFR